ncbi:hypothetical protein CHUAL_005675 [Chamberlinius hualienensis]
METFKLTAILIIGVLLFFDRSTVDAAVSCNGKKFTAKSTAYYPSNDGNEGGYVDCKGKSLQTLQSFLAGKASYVSVAMDKNLKIKYGTKLCIPELNKKYGKNIEFRVVDTGPSFTAKGYSRIDICVSNKQNSFDTNVNGKLTLIFPSLATGKPCCSCK